MINIGMALMLLLIHFLGDFVLQTDEQAKLKSTNELMLTYHVAVYSAIWFLFILFWTGSLATAGMFALGTFMAHWATDWCTSRIGKKFWDKGDTHNGFIVVGFDQILHYTQLFITWSLLMGGTGE